VANEEVLLGFIVISRIILGFLGNRCSIGLSLAFLWRRSYLFGTLLFGLGVGGSR